MSDHEPSNAVLLTKLEGLHAMFLSYQVTNSQAQADIIVQTTKTNGRVSALEKSKNMLVGAFLLLNVFAVPVIVALILKYLKA